MLIFHPLLKGHHQELLLLIIMGVFCNINLQILNLVAVLDHVLLVKDKILT